MFEKATCLFVEDCFKYEKALLVSSKLRILLAMLRVIAMDQMTYNATMKKVNGNTKHIKAKITYVQLTYIDIMITMFDIVYTYRIRIIYVRI